MFKIFEKNLWLTWVIVVILGATIFYFSSLKGGQTGGSGFPFQAIIYHIIIFFLFSIFLMIAISKGKYHDGIFIAIILSALYAVTDELHQYFVPGRSTSVGDFLLDSFGIFFALVVYSIRFKLRKR